MQRNAKPTDINLHLCFANSNEPNLFAKFRVAKQKLKLTVQYQQNPDNHELSKLHITETNQLTNLGITELLFDICKSDNDIHALQWAAAAHDNSYTRHRGNEKATPNDSSNNREDNIETTKMKKEAKRSHQINTRIVVVVIMINNDCKQQKQVAADYSGTFK